MARGIEHPGDALAAEWDGLADATGAPPWTRPGWFRAWTDAFGRAPLDACVVRRDGRLAALLPLERRRRRASAPANWHTPELIPLARDDTAARELADALLACRPARLHLSFLRRPSPFVDALQARARAAGYRVLTRTYARAPYVDLSGDWESYWGGLPGHFRANVRRRRRELEREGPLRLEVVDGSSDLEHALHQAFTIEASGWKGRNGTAVTSRPETRAFYTAIARWAHDRGWLRLAFLVVGEQPIATAFALDDGTAFATLKVGYDESFRRYGPGFELDRALIEDCFARGLRRYEFLGTETEAKRRWTSTSRELVLVQAFAPGLAGLAAWSAFRYGRPAARRALALARRSRS